MAVDGARTECVSVAVAAEVHVTGRRGARQPAPPGPAVGRYLDVVACDVAVVCGSPAHHEPAVALPLAEHGDASQRRRGVVQELRAQLLVELGVGAVVAQSPHADTPQPRPVDQVVAQPQGCRIVVVDLSPGGDAAIGRAAVLLLVRDIGRGLEGIPSAAVLGDERLDVLVVD